MRITIVATSARWLAESCSRAGWRPEAIDLFGDWDLLRCCPTLQVAELAQSLSDSRDDFCPIFFGNGFERLVASGCLARLPRFTLNTSIESVNLCRDPEVWSELLRKAGHVVPEYCLDVAEFSRVKSDWLVKPVTGSGGFGIRRFDQSSQCQIETGSFLQEFIPGKPASLVALGDGQSARLLGCFQQIVGDCGFGVPDEFCFVGCVGPVSFGNRVQKELQAIANEIATKCGIRGIFGIDFLVNHDRPVIVEINPRPTSSCELLELASETSLMPMHVHALSKLLSELETGDVPANSDPVCFGKAYVFWNQLEPAKITQAFHGWLIGQHSAAKAADIPMVHSAIPPNSPIATVFASGPNSDQVYESLREMATEMLERVAGSQ